MSRDAHESSWEHLKTKEGRHRVREAMARRCSLQKRGETGREGVHK